MKIKIGTRGSKLALYQAEYVKARLEELDLIIDAEITVIKTKGDKILDVPLAKIGDKGLFVKEIESAISKGKVDIGVHSSKDMPTVQPDGLTLSTFLKRETPNDAFVSNRYKSLDDLPDDAVVGTSSLRRRSQILSLKPDLKIRDIRGNVDTRLKKLDDGEYDAILLAVAGMKRLGLEERITEVIPLDKMIPAVGQGAIAVESRSGDETIQNILQRINDEETATAVREERAFLQKLEGGCQVPIGCHAFMKDDVYHIHGYVGSLDGQAFVRESLIRAPGETEGMGLELAEIALKKGAYEILKEIER